MKGRLILFIAGFPAPCHSAMTPSVYFDPPAREADTFQKDQEYDHQVNLSAREMAEVAVIVSEAWRAWKKQVGSLFVHESKRSSPQKTARLPSVVARVRKDFISSDG